MILSCLCVIWVCVFGVLGVVMILGVGLCVWGGVWGVLAVLMRGEFAWVWQFSVGLV